MHILLTNDDGIHAPGLLSLAAALSQEHRVTVVAPDRERSAASHSLTLDRPLTAKTVEHTDLSDCLFYSVNGTPVDCVRIGLGPLADSPIDLVVAGINNGANLGGDISYSGTVHAALEGAVCGLPAIAFSLRIAPNEQKHERSSRFASSAAQAVTIVNRTPLDLLRGRWILNVNFPADSSNEVRVCPQGISLYDTVFQSQTDPYGRDFYWVCAVKNESEYNEKYKTDVYWCSQGAITITPLAWNATANEALPIFARLFSGDYNNL